MALHVKKWFRRPQKTWIPELDKHRNSWPWERMSEKDRDAVKDCSRWICYDNTRLQDTEKSMRNAKHVKKSRKIINWAEDLAGKNKSPDTFKTLFGNAKKSADAVWKDMVDGQTSIGRAFSDYQEGDLVTDVRKSQEQLAQLIALAQKKEKNRLPFKIKSFSGLYTEFVWFHISELLIKETTKQKRDSINKTKKKLRELMDKYGVK